MAKKLKYSTIRINQNDWCKNLLIDLYMPSIVTQLSFIPHTVLYPIRVVDNTIIAISLWSFETRRAFNIDSAIQISFDVDNVDIPTVHISNPYSLNVTSYKFGSLLGKLTHRMYALPTDYIGYDPQTFMPMKVMYLASI